MAPHDNVNAIKVQSVHNYTHEDVKEDIRDEHVELHRDLKARHINMIAIRGAIGTGLIISTGKPASLFIAYSFMGFIMWMVMCALSKMAAWLPLPSGFTGYTGQFCDPALGFTLGWCYYIKYIILPLTQLTATALIIAYWPHISTENVNSGVWIAIFMVTIIMINYFSVRIFGEIEFWLSIFKVLVMIGIILCSLNDLGVFAHKYTEGLLGKFLAFWLTIISAMFVYLGTKLIGIILKVIKLAFWRIIIFYILSMLLMGMLVPYNSDNLAFATKASNSTAASPFITVIKQVPALLHIINACILVFVFLAANSNLYIATRILYGLAREHKAPRIFAKTNDNSIPIYTLGFSSLFCCLAFTSMSEGSKDVFGYFIDVVSIIRRMLPASSVQPY
ncbi:amino acid permease/ SLC12A domain-containing protein [Aspergillus crustosus]